MVANTTQDNRVRPPSLKGNFAPSAAPKIHLDPGHTNYQHLLKAAKTAAGFCFVATFNGVVQIDEKGDLKDPKGPLDGKNKLLAELQLENGAKLLPAPFSFGDEEALELHNYAADTQERVQELAIALSEVPGTGAYIQNTFTDNAHGIAGPASDLTADMPDAALEPQHLDHV